VVQEPRNYQSIFRAGRIEISQTGAKALVIAVSQTLLVAADEVIE
jgi:hypothetical protein